MRQRHPMWRRKFIRVLRNPVSYDPDRKRNATSAGADRHRIRLLDPLPHHLTCLDATRRRASAQRLPEQAC